MGRDVTPNPTATLKGAGSWPIEGLHGGVLLGARSSSFVIFWDWETGEIVRRIDVEAKNVMSHVPRKKTYQKLTYDRFPGPARVVS